MKRAVGAALAAAIVLCGAGPVAAAFFDVLYIKANVGESAGGHSAIRFADAVYHFQNDAGGILRLRRTPDRQFRWSYAVLQNRTIHVARIDVSEETHDRLRDAFNHRFLLHNAHARILRAHVRDRELLETLIAADHGGEVRFPLRGAGLFAATREERSAGPSPSIAALRARVIERYGPTFLRERLVTLRARLRGLRRTAPGADLRFEKDRHPAAALHLSERYEALGLQILALDVLEHSRPVAPDAILDPGDTPLAFSPELRRQLKRFAAYTEDRLVARAGSEGPDWGFALLLGMARLDVLHAAHATGRLLMLDAFPDDAETIAAASVVRRHAFMQELAAEAETKHVRARERLLAADPVTEREFSAFERATNRRVELWRGAYQGDPVRTASRPLLPASRGSVPALPRLDRTMADLQRDVERARATFDAYVQALEATFGYDLFTANCATEIFTLIESTLGSAETTRLLGGRVAPERGLHFVPGVAHRAVLANWNLTAVGEIPSYRRARVSDMYDDELPVAVYLRESSRLTSTVYRTNNADAFFLFFTDDAVAPRPLFGLANIAAGAGQALWGTLRAPFDHGKAFRSGVRGVVFSLPELFWLNIRKGTFEYGLSHVESLEPTMRMQPPVRAP